MIQDKYLPIAPGKKLSLVGSLREIVPSETIVIARVNTKLLALQQDINNTISHNKI